MHERLQAELKVNSAKIQKKVLLYMGVKEFGNEKKKKQELYCGQAGFVFRLCFLGRISQAPGQQPGHMMELANGGPAPKTPREVSTLPSHICGYRKSGGQ